MLTLKEAAEKIGKSKVALQQQIKRGKISASRNDKGHYLIDPAELFRIYPEINDNHNKQLNDTYRKDNEIEKDLVIAQLQAELASRITQEDRLLEEIKGWKQRLDSSEKERRETQEKLTALLTDQRVVKKSFISRLLSI